MTTSPQLLLELGFLADAGGTASFRSGASSASSGNRSDGDSSQTTITNFPDFRANAATLTQTSRIAARLNAASVSDEELDQLLAERQSLIDKKLQKKISREEVLRLEYVRWTLDRIDDARNGEALDRIENRLNQYEDFLLSLEGFKASLDRAQIRKK